MIQARTTDGSGVTKGQAYLVTTAAALGWLFDSVVVNLFTVSLPQLETAFELTAISIGVISSLFLAGYAIGTLVGGTLADYIGRRVSLGLSIILYTLFSGLTAFAPGFGALAGFRFLTGVGAGTELPVGAAYVAEVAPPHARGLWIGVMNSVFSLGIFVAALTLAICGNWRWAFMATFVMGALVFLVRSRAEESPRFVQVKADIKAGRVVRKPTIAEVFGPLYRGRTIRIMLLWLGYWMFWWSWSIFVPKYLGAQLKVPKPDVIKVMMGYALGAFVLQIAAGWLSDRAGRRLVMAGFMVPAIVVIWLWSTMGPGVAAILVGGLAFGLALAPVGVMLAYTTELFPTALRGTGQSMTIGIARLISVAAPTVSGIVAASFGTQMEFRFSSCFMLLSVICALFGPETRDVILDEEPRIAPEGASAMRPTPVAKAAR